MINLLLLLLSTFVLCIPEQTCDADGTCEGEVEQVQQTSADPNKLEVFFINSAEGPCDIYWLNGGQKVFHNSLKSGERMGMSTWIGHQFVATPKDYRATLKKYTMQKGQRQYIVTQDLFDRLTSTDCVDRIDDCHAGGNRCENGWMIVNCAQTCNETSELRDYCALRDPNTRCQPEFLNLTMSNNLKPGDLKLRVERILTNPDFEKFSPSLISEDPPILQFDTFLTDNQCDALFSTTGPFERSTDTGSKNKLGEAKRVISKTRTSQNAWCRHRCMANQFVKEILANVEDVTQVPLENFEAPQVLHYDVGQFYRAHLDRGSANTDGTLSGGRIFTFFLYCSDVEDGGETGFPRIGLDVAPKRGRAILWPSVKDSNPTGPADVRTFHEAKPVKKGEKLAANVWIHQRNFKVPNDWGCTGAFD